MDRLTLDAERVIRSLVLYIRQFTVDQGFTRLVVGLSGGMDSTVAAYLAAEALGPHNVVGVFLPHAVSHPASLKDAQTVAKRLNLPTRKVAITPFVKAYQKAFPDMTDLQQGNVMARCRMIVLFQVSAEEHGLVMGTSNKSEILLGYGTLHGDLASAFMPLGDLYKTQVRQLASFIGVPDEIQQKPPSADLWAGQSDEDELGVTYAEADRLFVRWIDEGYTRDRLLKEGFKAKFIDKVIGRVESQRFKSTPPPIPKLTDLLQWSL